MEFRKKIISSHSEIHDIKSKLRKHALHTVCEEARCPNIGECFSRGTATFMILGNVCTRSCGFCNVKHLGTSSELRQPDVDEPVAIAKMVLELKLRHVVITSVTRDDLEDEGAGQFALTIEAIKRADDPPTVEVLTPDFNARTELLRMVCEAGPAIYNHNIETVRRLTPIVRSKAEYDRSLKVLDWVRSNYPKIRVKSGLMVGLGEKREEVVETLKDLKTAGCEIVTIGQYLAPSKKNIPVAEYLKEEDFEGFKVKGEELGIRHIFSGSFVRSSYMADRF